jgi:hypothetical protein
MIPTNLPRASAEPRRAAGRWLARAAASSGVLCAILLAGGCATAHPAPIAAGELAEAQLFPYYPLYWVGPTFDGHHLVTVDGLKGYSNSVGDSVYYGDCLQSKGVFSGGSCQLPLQVSTVIYRPHSNTTLGPQRNIVERGVPATVYDEGRSLELYTGRVAIDIFSDSYAHALKAASELRAVNAPGSSSGGLPAPIYCPGLSGAMDAQLASIMQRLSARICQRTASAKALEKSLSR